MTTVFGLLGASIKSLLLGGGEDVKYLQKFNFRDALIELTKHHDYKIYHVHTNSNHDVDLDYLLSPDFKSDEIKSAALLVIKEAKIIYLGRENTFSAIFRAKSIAEQSAHISAKSDEEDKLKIRRSCTYDLNYFLGETSRRPYLISSIEIVKDIEYRAAQLKSFFLENYPSKETKNTTDLPSTEVYENIKPQYFESKDSTELQKLIESTTGVNRNKPNKVSHDGIASEPLKKVSNSGFQYYRIAEAKSLQRGWEIKVVGNEIHVFKGRRKFVARSNDELIKIFC
jgi:hypothetical protein